MLIRFGCNAFVFVFILFYSSYAVLYEGDKCSLKDGNEDKCTSIYKCRTAVELLKTGGFPINCGFKQNEAIVCCKDGEKASKTTNTTTITDQVSNRAPGDISKQKCREYAEYAYEKTASPTLLLKPHFKTTLVCDIQRNKLLIGSTVASRREFPHMALIGYKPYHNVIWNCGGSLISENFVLTAADCLSSASEGPAELVRVGITNKTDSMHMQERTVSEIIQYPKYNNTLYHDIGLLRLSKNVEFNTYVRPSCLQTQKYIPYDIAIVSSWGGTFFSTEYSNELLQTAVEFYDTRKCNSSYRTDIFLKRLKDGIVDDLMICTVTSRTVKTICHGGVGSPIQVYHKETEEIKCMYDVVGIISFTRGCGLGIPLVNTRVSAYIEWIEDIVWPK